MSEKLTLQEELAAIDVGARHLWDQLTDEQQKGISLYILNRYASSINTSNRLIQEYAILKTNEYYNKHYFTLAKHPKLLWYLLCMCGDENQQIRRHKWIGIKKEKKNKCETFLQELYPHVNDTELEILTKINTRDDLIEYCRDLGMDDKDINL